MMSLCSENHDEVCFEGRQCPVCDKMTDIAALEEEIKRLKEEAEANERMKNESNS